MAQRSGRPSASLGGSSSSSLVMTVPDADDHVTSALKAATAGYLYLTRVRKTRPLQPQQPLAMDAHMDLYDDEALVMHRWAEGGTRCT